MDLGIKLDFEPHIPLHDQIVEQIRGLVATGELEAGERLPAACELASILDVNFTTVARAYRRLDVEGLLSTQQGRGD